MSDDVQPIEQTPVQLTRMEGILTLIDYKVDALVSRVDRHERELSTLTLSVQSLEDARVADTKERIATAEAVKSAKDAQEAVTRAIVAKSDQSWSTLTRVFAVATAVLVLMQIYQAFAP